MGNTILNIAGGKIPPLNIRDYQPYFLVNVDTMYYENTPPFQVEEKHRMWAKVRSELYKVNEDIFTFLERSTLMFDRICAYRFLEHIPMDKVLYFIYLLSTAMTRGSQVEIIVPNYLILANMLIHEEEDIMNETNFEAHNILLTTELLNEPSCPHASIWTPWRCRHFFSLEGRFIVKEMDEQFQFDGRDIYLRFVAERQ